MALEEPVAVNEGLGGWIQGVGAERQTLPRARDARDHAHEAGQLLALESEAAGVTLGHGIEGPPEHVGARAVLIEDSSEGETLLIVGGRFGLRLEHEESGHVVREPYLVLARTTRVE